MHSKPERESRFLKKNLRKVPDETKRFAKMSRYSFYADECCRVGQSSNGLRSISQRVIIGFQANR